jgi:hypothetical protein
MLFCFVICLVSGVQKVEGSIDVLRHFRVDVSVVVVVGGEFNDNPNPSLNSVRAVLTRKFSR